MSMKNAGNKNREPHKVRFATWERQLAAGAPGGTRTPDLLVRSQTLYPAELLAHGLFSNSLLIIHTEGGIVKGFLQVCEIL